MNRSKSIRMGTTLGILFMVSMLFLATTEAQTIGTPGNKWVNPNHGSSIGDCADDGKWCWSITIGDDEPHWGYPIEYHGQRAKRLIADGRIDWANMNRHGIMYLGVWSRYDNRPFDCTINVSRRHYYCESHH